MKNKKNTHTLKAIVILCYTLGIHASPRPESRQTSIQNNILRQHTVKTKLKEHNAY